MKESVTTRDMNDGKPGRLFLHALIHIRQLRKGSSNRTGISVGYADIPWDVMVEMETFTLETLCTSIKGRSGGLNRGRLCAVG
jgi:hypothetical protein